MPGEINPPFRPPKNGHTYEFISVTRVSDPSEGKQDIKSLDEQQDVHRLLLARNLVGPSKLTVIAGSGSGELLDRDELLHLVELITTDRYDGVICEDLGRIARRMYAYFICEQCEDNGTRLIAINDRVDTDQPGWREAAIFAAMHHERSNRDTSERIKRSSRGKFLDGRCLRHEIYGWKKPNGAKFDKEMYKNPDAIPIYTEWFRRLDEDEASFVDIARWLNELNVPVTPWRNGNTRWDDKMVGRHTYNVMLKGVRERNNRKTKRKNNPGKYFTIKADPEELLTRKVPHLAFFDEAYYDRVIAEVRRRNGKCKRAKDGEVDPCAGRSRKSSTCPGGMVYCGICNRLFRWGGNGRNEHMMCGGAHGHTCWLGTTFDGIDAAHKIASAVWGEVERLEGFDSAFLEIVTEEGRALDADNEKAIKRLTTDLAGMGKAIANVMAFIRGGIATESTREELIQLEAKKARIAGELDEVKRKPTHVIDIPEIDVIKQIVQQRLGDLAIDGPDFARVIRKLVPRIVVFPYRLCDGGRVVLRAKFRLQLANLLPDKAAAEVLRRPLERVVEIDLFEKPQREAFRHRVVAARANGKTERDIAQALGITIAATQAAMALHPRPAPDRHRTREGKCSIVCSRQL